MCTYEARHCTPSLRKGTGVSVTGHQVEVKSIIERFEAWTDGYDGDTSLTPKTGTPPPFNNQVGEPRSWG